MVADNADIIRIYVANLMQDNRDMTRMKMARARRASLTISTAHEWILQTHGRTCPHEIPHWRISPRHCEGSCAPPPRPPTADLKMVESGRCPGQRRRMFSRGFISSVVNNVFLVSFCGGALRGLFPKRVPVPLCSAPEAGSDTATQLDQSTHCDRAVWMCGCTCRRH